MTNIPKGDLAAQPIAKSLERMEAAELPAPLIGVVSESDFRAPAQSYDPIRRGRHLETRLNFTILNDAV